MEFVKVPLCNVKEPRLSLHLLLSETVVRAGLDPEKVECGNSPGKGNSCFHTILQWLQPRRN